MTKLRKLLALMLVLTLVVTAATVSAAAATTAIAFNKSTNLKLNVGDTYTRTATTIPAGGTVTYTSSRPAVATVNATGRVICKKVGKTVITATSGKQTASYNLTVVAAVSSTAGASATQPDTDSSSETCALSGYTVNINDMKTLATTAAGDKWPIDKFYFYSSSGKSLGNISGSDMDKILEKFMVKVGDGWGAPGNDGDWSAWFAVEFNKYRGLSGGSNAPGGSPFTIDTEAAAQEIIKLVNQEREKGGLDAIVADESMMQLAATRARELSETFSHKRPNGTYVTDFNYAENIHFGSSTSDDAMEAWMNSKGHRAAIMYDQNTSFGAGVYQNNMGRVFWVLVFGHE